MVWARTPGEQGLLVVTERHGGRRVPVDLPETVLEIGWLPAVGAAIYGACAAGVFDGGMVRSTLLFAFCGSMNSRRALQAFEAQHRPLCSTPMPGSTGAVPVRAG